MYKRFPFWFISTIMVFILLFSLFPAGSANAGSLGQGNGEKRAYDPETGQLILVSGDAATLRAMVGDLSALSTE